MDVRYRLTWRGVQALQHGTTPREPRQAPVTGKPRASPAAGSSPKFETSPRREPNLNPSRDLPNRQRRRLSPAGFPGVRAQRWPDIAYHETGMGVDETLLNEIVRRVLSVARRTGSFCLVSAATGQMTRDSDIDLLVIEPRWRTLTRGEWRSDAVGDVGYPVDVIVMRTERFEETKRWIGRHWRTRLTSMGASFMKPLIRGLGSPWWRSGSRRRKPIWKPRASGGPM